MTSIARMNQSSAPQRQSKILAVEPLWLLLLAPFLLFPGRFLSPQWQPLVVLALFLFWPLRWWLQGNVAPPTPVRLSTLLFLLTILLPIYVSIDRVRSWEVAGYLLFGVVVANALINAPGLQARPQRIVWALLVCLAGLALLGPWIVAPSTVSSPVIVPLQRMAAPVLPMLGETINPNILANALLAILPFALVLPLAEGWTRRRWLRMLVALLALVGMGVLYLTESRGALFAAGVILILIAVLRFPRLLWPVVIAGAGVVVYLLYSGAGALDTLTQATNGSATSGIAERIELWERGIYAIQDFPLTGIGLGTFSTVVPFLYPFLIIPPNTFLPDAHNLLIQVGVDLGVAGLISFLAIILGMFVMMLQVLGKRHGAGRDLRWALAAGVFASFVGMLVAGIFAATNWGVKPAFLPWVIGALGVLVHWQHVADRRLPSVEEVAPENAPGVAAEGAGEPQP